MQIFLLRIRAVVLLLFVCAVTTIPAQSVVSGLPRGYTLTSKEEQDFVQEIMEHQRISLADAKVKLEQYKEILAKTPQKLPVEAATAHKNPVVNASCSNLDFSTGTTANWTTTGYANVVSLGTDSFGGFPKAAPGGSYSLQLGNPYPVLSPYPPAFAINSSASQTFTVSAANPVILLQFAFVILNFGHAPTDAAWVKIDVRDNLGNIIFCSQDSAYDSPGGPKGFVASSVMGYQNDPFLTPGSYVNPQYPTTYLPWQTANLDLSTYVGTNVTLEVKTSWCRFNYDWAYCYFNAICAPPNKVIQSDTLCKSNAVPLCAPPGFVTYSWTGPSVTGQTTQCVNTSTPGNYSVVCTNFEGCIYTYNYVLKITLDQLTSAFTDALGAVCTGNFNFTNSSTSNPLPITNYQWSFGDGTTSNATSPSHNYGLAANTYDVKLVVTSTDGCKDSVTEPVTVNAAITPTPSSTPASCGSSNGTIGVTATGGNGVYNYSWSNNISTQNQTGLVANSYTVTVTDGTGCTNSAVATVASAGGGGTATMAPPVNVSCAGLSNGSATVNVAGGNPGYTYAWSNGATTFTSLSASTTNTASNISAGNWVVTVTDASGCNSVTNVAVSSPAAILPVPSSSPSTCGNSNGGVGVTASGGTGAFTYSWSSGQPTQTVNGLAAGPYTVTVTDANTCTSTAIATITNTSGATVTMGAPSVLKCFGDANATLSVTATGGTPDYTYSWSTGVNSVTTNGTSALTNLGAGVVSVSVSDASGCQVIRTVTINQPAKLTLAATGLSTKCNGSCDGQAVVIPAGGTAPVIALWSTGGTNLSINGLCSGSYSVTLSDANSCQKDTTFMVPQPAAITESLSSKATNCNQSVGSATVVTVAGGTGAFNYSWNNGQTTQTATNLPQGEAVVTIKDINGCIGKDSVLVANNAGVVASISGTTPLLCSGNCNATATSAGIGGAGPYNYSWSGGGGTAAVASNLCKGNYSVTITDANNCTSSASTIITQPTPVVLAPLTPSTMCIGQSTLITATPSGGTAGYTVTWTPGNIVANSFTDSLKTTATFTEVATDANGCVSLPQSVTITVNPPLSLTAHSPAPVCPGAMVNLTSLAGGGDGTYNYTWLTNPLQNTQNVTVAVTAARTYSVIVNDNCGTPADTVVVTVGLNPVPVVDFISDKKMGCPLLCVNFTDKSTVATGNIASWSWGFGNDSTSSVQNSSCCYKTGVYSVWLKATSDKGCTATDTIPNMITVFADPVAAFTTNPQTEATIVAPTYSFVDQSTTPIGNIVRWSWNLGDPTYNVKDTVENPSHTYPQIGQYCPKLMVTNTAGCTDTITHCIDIGPDFTFFIPNAFTPNGDGINDYFFGQGIGITSFKMLIFDRWGNMIFTSYDLTTPWDGRANGGNDVAQQDVYSYVIDLQDVFSKHHNYVGHVTLVR